MLWCETGGADERDIADLAVFASQLNAAGMPAAIHVRSAPPDLSRNTQFDLAPLLRDRDLEPDDAIVLTGAHRLTDDALARLRRLSGGGVRRSLAIGQFARRQDAIGAMARLSYVLHHDPEIFNLADHAGPDGDLDDRNPVFGVARISRRTETLGLLLVAPDLEDRAQVSAIESLALTPRYRVAVLTNGKAKQAFIDARSAGFAIYHYSEILPRNLAERIDVCVCFAPYRNNYRVQCLIANLVVSGAALIDGTPDRQLESDRGAFVRGPSHLAPLAGFIDREILPNLSAIGTRTRASAAAADLGSSRLKHTVAALGAGRGAKTAPDASASPSIVFLPTNGVGLGHAQRCVLVASEMEASQGDLAFAAFPSCTRLVKSYGYDAMPLVARSGHHAESHANDLVNYLRLRALTRGSRGLVFDGGYIFDSVFRTIFDNRLNAVWMRRGLWQSHQDNSIALDREKAFARVIVPRDAFDELNVGYSYGPHVALVGPVVRRLDMTPEARTALRERVAARYDLRFDRLVVSFLGGGVAADRGAQTQALCAMMERQTDTLHLVITWPSAVLQPAWFQWRNSRVVKTHHASALAAAADLCVSAAGYNSFHEALYNGIPSIFVPQTGAFMDDQPARARAAGDRGLGVVVEAHELMTLEREVLRLLDGGGAEALRASLRAYDLPEPGNVRAAELIRETCDASQSLERDTVADRPAGRG